MRTYIFLFTALLVALHSSGQTDTKPTDKPILIQEQGSFAIGGTVLTDESGNTFHGDHAYVFYQMPVNARRYPLVFAHGLGQFSKTWETTPDGREGFQNIFLRRGFGVYLVDQPRRGNAGRSTEKFDYTPVCDEQVWFNRFRIGIWPDYYEGVQFPKDKESLEQYFRQMTPTIGPINFDVYSDAYAALINKIGPSILITHSQGGPVGWFTARKTENIKAIISYEPGGQFPFPKGESPTLSVTESGFSEAIEVPETVFLTYTKYPIIIYYGDYLPPIPSGNPEQDAWRFRLELAGLWAEAINKRGGDATVIYLPDAGLHGNTHFPFSDLNNIEVADLLSVWLHEKELNK